MTTLRIEPNNQEVHFWLDDETPETSLTLSQFDPKGPLIYRIQPTQKHRFAIWPGVGVVESGSKVMVSIVLLERARAQLQMDLQTHGAEAEIRANDRILVEWCRAPDVVLQKMKGDPDQDYDILASFWTTRGYEFSTPIQSARQPLNVRYSVHNFPPVNESAPKEYPNPPLLSHPKHGGLEKGTSNPRIVATVSTDASTTQAETTVTCDDSLMLSVSTWGEELGGISEELAMQRRRSPYNGEGGRLDFKRPRHGRSFGHASDLAGPASSPLSPSALAMTTTTTTTKKSSPAKGSIHRYQLRQVLRCGGCYQVFDRDPNVLTIPVMSQACGHTICRGCVVRTAEEDFARTGTYQDTVSCPLCHSTNAFQPELLINQSLCAVIALLDS